VLANTLTCDSFGNVTKSTGTLRNPFNYTAREFDSETGLYYYRARYYDPAGCRIRQCCVCAFRVNIKMSADERRA